jgi:hypothetical protein
MAVESIPGDQETRIEQHASSMPPTSEDSTEEEEAEERVRTGAFGGLTPAEAASRRWQRQRQREQDDAAAAVYDRSGEVLVVRTTVETGKIIARLSADAKQGSTQAARELREWLNRVDIERDTDVSALDRATRQRLKARILAEMHEEEAAAGDEPGSDAPATPIEAARVDQPDREGEATPASDGTPVAVDA